MGCVVDASYLGTTCARGESIPNAPRSLFAGAAGGCLRARIDGCSDFAIFWRIVLPLSGPGLVTVGVLAFVASWNAYLLPLLLLGDPTMQTLPLGVQLFSTQYSQDTALVLAFTTLAMLPAIIFFTIAQRNIVGGLTGAVKG